MALVLSITEILRQIACAAFGDFAPLRDSSPVIPRKISRKGRQERRGREGRNEEDKPRRDAEEIANNSEQVTKSMLAGVASCQPATLANFALCYLLPDICSLPQSFSQNP